jgi:uncharacterized protein (TIGR04222 family)
VNVLELSGPSFLLLYAVVAAMTCIIVWWSIRIRETPATASPLRVRDPYEIAYLRGGTEELVKVVILALMRRSLLAPVGQSLQTTAGAAAVATASIEREILATCHVPIRANGIAQFGKVQAAGRNYHQALAAKHLVPNAAMLRARIPIAAIAWALLGGFALLKIAHALATGHANVELLLCFVVIATIVLFKIVSHPRTANGDRALTHLDALFSRVKNGPRPVNPDQLNEALLLAAVYGDYAEPGTELDAWHRLFPAPGADNKTSDGGGSSCGSGCGGGGGCGGCGS